MTDFKVSHVKSSVNYTADQLVAKQGLVEFIAKPFDPNDYVRGLCGAGGTGKTFVIKHIINECGLSHSVVGLSCPTHKAARVLRESTGLPVSTIHSDLGLRPDFNLDDFDESNIKFSKQGKSKLPQYKLYIVDEASMLNKGLISYLKKEAVRFGFKLCFLGDASQLAPVKEAYSTAFIGVKTFFLNEVVRQGGNNPLLKVLDMLRYDVRNKKKTFLTHIFKHREDYVNGLGYKVVNSQDFTNQVISSFSDKELERNIDKVRLLAYTNSSVTSWNHFIRNNVISHNNDIITKDDLIMSYETIVDSFNDRVLTNSEDYIINKILDWRDDKYGMKGFMVNFFEVHGGRKTLPLFVVDHTDRFSVELYYKTITELLVKAKNAPITKRSEYWTEYYKFKRDYLLLVDLFDATGSRVTSRSIDYGFSITVHKSQGSTYDNVLIDLNDILYVNGLPNPNIDMVNRLLYVAISRARESAILRL